ncbi:hypothetical protein GOV06_04925 [Candidatus Woesearchaeota archaeon]|nr:hypothetical protein [Candidatus Woesearchaeota archaeon]
MKLVKIILTTSGFALFLLSIFVLFEPTDSPTGFFAYTPNLAIINSNNNIQLNSDLEIEFITKGKNDLTIIPLGDMKMIGLRCGDIIIGNSLEYKDYECKKDSFLVVKILSEELKIGLKFGNNVQYSENTAPMPKQVSGCGCGK